VAVAQPAAVESSRSPAASGAPARGAPRWHDAVAIVAILAGLVALWSEFGALFPQAEFVDWSTPSTPLGNAIWQAVQAVVSFDHVYHTRVLSLLWATGAGHACGTGIGCLNAVMFVPVAVSAFALFAAGRVLGLPATAALAVVAVLLASQPTFEVLSWQATVHDRMANAATWLAVIAFFLAVRRVRRMWRSLVPWAAGLALLGLLAMHTKESAWPLLALAVAAPLLLARDRRQALTAAMAFALPVALMLADAITQYLVVQDDPHVAGGNVSNNLRALTTYAVPGGVAIAVAVVGVALAAAAYVLLRRRHAPDAVALLRVAAWVAVAAVCGWVIPARTQFPSAFYMFVPLATASLAVALALRAGFLALPDRARPAYRYGAAAIGLALTAWFVGGALGGRYDQYRDVARASDTFRHGFARIAAIRRQHPSKQIQFAVPNGLYYGYRFVTASPAADLFRLSGAEQPIDVTYATGATPPPCGTKGTVVIRLDGQLQPASTC
jgi:hypothetical protein